MRTVVKRRSRSLRAGAWGAEEGVSVETVALPFGAFDSKLETAIPRGNGPDLFVAAHSGLGKWVAMDLLEPVVNAPADQLPVSLEALTWDDTLWAEPLAYKSLLLLYDPSRVTEVPTTTGELIAQARSYTTDDSFGLVYQASEPYYHGAWMHAFGAELITAEGDVADSPRKWRGTRSPNALPSMKRSHRAANGRLVSTLYREETALSLVVRGLWPTWTDRSLRLPSRSLRRLRGRRSPTLRWRGRSSRSMPLSHPERSVWRAICRRPRAPGSDRRLESRPSPTSTSAATTPCFVPWPSRPSTAYRCRPTPTRRPSLRLRCARFSPSYGVRPHQRQRRRARRVPETMTRPVEGVSPRPYLAALLVWSRWRRSGSCGPCAPRDEASAS